MAGFRYCKWCDGKGCVGCDTEQKKFAERALAAAPKWRPGDVRDIRDATVQAELERRVRGLDSLSEDDVEKVFKPALDAEYNRQFPNGPQPILTVARGDETGMALLKHVLHADVLNKAFGAGGGGMAEIEDRAAEARSLQSLHKAAEESL